MAIRLENEFVVNAPLDETWPALLDLKRVSRCLPGATLEPAEGEEGYRGTMKVKLGPVTTEYEGTAKLEDVDEAGRRASVRVEGKERRGQGTASALIRNRLETADGATRVVVESEVNVTGKPAQFGRGIMQGVAAKLLDEFATCLEAEISGDSTNSQDAEALDVGPAARGAFRRPAALVAGLGLAVLALRFLRRR